MNLYTFSFRAGLEELSSKEIQWARWVEGRDQLQGSIEEATCRVFDDSGYNRMSKEEREVQLPSVLLEMLSDLAEAIRLVNTDQSVSALINSEEMVCVRRVSSGVLSLFLESMPTIE